MSNHVAPGPEAHDELDFQLPGPRKVGKRRLLLIAGIVGAVLLVAFLATWLPKRAARKTLVTDTENRANDVPRVEVISPKVVSSDQPILYAATIEALEETVIFPRVDGYVNSWLVDLGDHVSAGELLAQIDTPELDQELAQARADLVQAQAQLVQSKATRVASSAAAKRTVTLTQEGVTSQQELEQRTAIAQ
ncbi:MAG: biotin/lipoyl-binding protein [Polyangiaceae bacterium]|nr:biotin/lipoyl-binding protein [Polyangiaceae bacterium]